MNVREFETRVRRVQERIAVAAERSGRPADEILILPITKGHSPAVLGAVAAAGFRAIGENRVAEAESKLADCGRLGLAWHMVGHLQRNKASRAVELFDVIESVDSLRLGHRLQRVAEQAGAAKVRLLVQVNAGGESSKTGVDPAAVVETVGELRELGRLAVEGLMTMAPLTQDRSELRAVFRTARRCLERCRRELEGFDGRMLSMGMSNDYEIAVEEGSTEVRLGTVLVGKRPGE